MDDFAQKTEVCQLGDGWGGKDKTRRGIIGGIRLQFGRGSHNMARFVRQCS